MIILVKDIPMLFLAMKKTMHNSVTMTVLDYGVLLAMSCMREDVTLG